MSSRTALLIAGGFVVAVGTLAWLAISHSENQTSGIPSSNRGQHTPDSLHEMIEILRPLHKKMGEPEPGDWLSMHEEEGQTFGQYLKSEPIVAEPGRRIIYIQPLGEFETEQREIVSLTAEFLEFYFGLPVKTLPVKPLDDVPPSARRVHELWGMKQVLTGYILDELLLPALPEDAVAMIGMTTSDLWPGEGWNFVFGQAYLRKRAGVWSIYRHGDPALSKADFRLCLKRTIATASHELGHMFSMSHCIAYLCNMNGSNSQEESDKGPLALCPECLAKLLWATGVDAESRFEKLEAFARKHGLDLEADIYDASLSKLRSR